MSFKVDREKLKDRNYTADDYVIDDSLEKGLSKKRRCTDVFWLLLFTGFIGLMVFMTGYGIVVGNPAKLMAPVVLGNKICGFSEGLENYPYFYIPNIAAALSDPTNLFMYGVCARSCPKNQKSELVCAPTSYYPEETCGNFARYESNSIARYCIPKEIPQTQQL